MSTPPKVFISYSHDSALQMDLVLALSNRLRGDGIDCNIDQYEESPAKGWSTWMLDEMEAAKFVLVVCNEAYYRRFRKQEEAGKGKGVIWESGLMTMDIYNAQGKSEKFIPITFQEGNDPNFVPDPLRDFTKYALQDTDGYDRLLNRLRGEPRTLKPLKIFYSYSRQDRALRDRLDKHLAPLRSARKIETWHDLQLEPGVTWERELLAKLQAADIILLLISADFMASEYCYSKELKIAIARHQAQEARVIPIILRDCDWNHEDVPFSVLKVLPPQAQPIASGTEAEIDRDFRIVARKIRELVPQLAAKRQAEINRQRQPLEQEQLAAEQEALRAQQVREARRQQEELQLEREQGQLFSFTTVKVSSHGQVIPQPEQTGRCLTFDLGGGVALEMVYVPAGSFLMGSNEYEDEQPIHQVTLPAFHIGKYPVTQAQYQAVMGHNSAHFQGNALYPVESVSWQQAREFCQKLSAQGAGTFRLPSEAQWEYACRAGTDTSFAYGEVIIADLGNFGETLKSPSPVGKYPPNNWGIHDMHGNVWEWCEDSWHKDYVRVPTDGSAWINFESSSFKILRGGSWISNPRICRSAYRNINGWSSDFVGFRVVCCAPRTLT